MRYSKVPTSAGAILWNTSGAKKFLRRNLRMLPLDQDLRMAWMWDLDTYGVVPAPALRDRCGPSRIDAMAPGWRGDAQRRRLLRKSRAEAPLVDLSFFARRGFVMGVVIGSLSMFTMIAGV